jgi:signal transduction histidine kinase
MPGATRGRLHQALAFIRSAEPRTAMSRRAVLTDIALAAAAAAVSVTFVELTYHGGGVAAATATSLPLAARRRYPLAAFGVVVLAACLTTRYATYVTFLLVIIAAYSAVVHSRFRGGPLLCLGPAGVALTVVYWRVSSAYAVRYVTLPSVPSRRVVLAPALFPARTLGLLSGADTQWRPIALVVLVSLVSIATVGTAMQAAERIRRMQAEHAADTRRALEQERSRIASEMHDVVTHSVSVMIVQAGAARQVLADAPGDARAALLAVESSGRAAMTELRHLLGLLSPADGSGDAAAGEATGAAGGTAAGDLRPQPGLGQLRALVDRMTAAGLPVDLHVGDVPEDLPPGLDLAAFRVIQEALTNVIKHAGKPRTRVRVDVRDGDLVLEVADAGRPIPAAGPAAPAAGRGLLGLRERAALYGGELQAGPQPGGGWLVRARIPAGASGEGLASPASRSPAAPATPPPAAPATPPPAAPAGPPPLAAQR